MKKCRETKNKWFHYLCLLVHQESTLKLFCFLIEEISWNKNRVFSLLLTPCSPRAHTTIIFDFWQSSVFFEWRNFVRQKPRVSLRLTPCFTKNPHKNCFVFQTYSEVNPHVFIIVSLLGFSSTFLPGRTCAVCGIVLNRGAISCGR